MFQARMMVLLMVIDTLPVGQNVVYLLKWIS